jgi:hypothetical protein
VPMPDPSLIDPGDVITSPPPPIPGGNSVAPSKLTRT